MSSSYDIDIELSNNSYRLFLSPYGASLRGFVGVDADGITNEIITKYSGADNKTGGQGDVLIPYPGRVNGGKYTFDGNQYQLPLNDKESPSSIHGFLRTLEWKQVSVSDTEAVFNIAMDEEQYKPLGYPFSLNITVSYKLLNNGMECSFTITNTGKKRAPVAAGFHPYFTLGTDLINENILHVPMESFLEFDGLLPTGRLLPVTHTHLDFQSPKQIGNTRFNTCFATPIRDTDGMLRIALTSQKTNRRINVWMDETFNYVVLYSGDPLPPSHSRKSLAIEPMTCGSDAFNHPEWGLKALEPGEEISGTWGVTVE